MSDYLSTNKKRKVEEDVEEEDQKRLKRDAQESSDDEQSDSSSDDKESDFKVHERLTKRSEPHFLWNPPSCLQTQFDILPDNIKAWAKANLAEAKGTKPPNSLYALAGAIQFLVFVYGKDEDEDEHEDIPFGTFVVKSVDDNPDIITEPGTTGIIKMTRVALEKRDVFSQSHTFDLYALAKKWGLPMVRHYRDSLPHTIKFQDLVYVLLWGFKIMYVD